MATIALDLDGTLITCESRQVSVLLSVAYRFGVNLDLSLVWARKRAGLSTRDALLEQGLDATLANRISAAWVDVVETPFWLSLDRCFPDTLATLTELGDQRVRRILITARSKPVWLTQQLTRLGIGGLLDEVYVVSPANTAAAKETVLREQQPLGFIGDTESDARAAEAAAVRYVALDRGQRSRKFLEDSGQPDICSSLPVAVRMLLGQ
ncbi:MAG: HAD hydrolase-like protein [Pseudomonadota bacterium]|nr:HAD hydrolase-like protein [Pseudomonadota bacterium]